MIRPIPLALVPEGTVAAAQVIVQGRILLGAGGVLTPVVLASLRKAGVLTISLDDGVKDTPPDAKTIVSTDQRLRPRFASHDPRHPVTHALYKLALLHHARHGLAPSPRRPAPPASTMGQAPVPSARDLATLVETIPPLPVSFLRINHIINDPHATVHAVGAVVASDSALALRALRVANSPIYALPGRIESIPQAVSLIGLQRIRSLAMASAVIDLFGTLPPGLIDTRRFWEHSLAVALSARTIAEFTGERDAERHFSAGLLHDVGLAVLAIAAPTQLAESLAAAAQGEPLCQAERRRLGFDHGDLGAALLERWSMPASLSEPVAAHHAGTSQRYGQETACVHVGEILAEALALGSVGEVLVPPLSPQAWDLLALPVTDLSRCAETTLNQHQALVAALLG